MDLAARFRSAVALAGRYPLLAGVDLDVLTGEVIVVRGPNGAGKTSLLRALAGLLPLVAGEAKVLGLDPSADARRLRPLVGLLGHRNGLYEDLSPLANVAFAASSSRRPRGEVGEALERLGLGARLVGLPVAKLSAGQRRRVALACVLVRRPRLWLLDEPHAGLDAEHRSLLDSLLAEVLVAGATVVFASHEERDWGPLSPREVTMSGGRLSDGLVGLEEATAPPVAPPRALVPPVPVEAAAQTSEEVPNVA